MKRLCYLLIILTLMLSNCSSDDGNPKCRVSEYNDNTYNYDSKGRFSKALLYNTLQLNFSYSSTQIVAKGSDDKFVIYVCKLDSKGNINEIGYDKGTGAIEFSDEYEYDSDGRVVRHINTNYPGEELFTYNTSGNITKIQYGDSMYEMEYDDEPNPLFISAFKTVWAISGIETYKILSKNNVTSVKITDASDTSYSFEETFEYNFNSDGLPQSVDYTVVLNGSSLQKIINYDYRCN